MVSVSYVHVICKIREQIGENARRDPEVVGEKGALSLLG